jgi:hypothetical protein
MRRWPFGRFIRTSSERESDGCVNDLVVKFHKV